MQIRATSDLPSFMDNGALALKNPFTKHKLAILRIIPIERNTFANSRTSLTVCEIIPRSYIKLIFHIVTDILAKVNL